MKKPKETQEPRVNRNDVEMLVMAARDYYNIDGEMTADAIEGHRERLRKALLPFISWCREV